MSAADLWHTAHAPVPGVPRYARLAAYAVPLVVLPSSLWRLPLLLNTSTSVGERTYILALSVFSEVLAFTAVGLIAAWGESFPSWLPYLRRRRVPTSAVLAAASLGALILTVMWPIVFTQVLTGTTFSGDPVDPDFPTQGGLGEALAFYACYLPLLLWGPLIAVAAYGYYRRVGPFTAGRGPHRSA